MHGASTWRVSKQLTILLEKFYSPPHNNIWCQMTDFQILTHKLLSTPLLLFYFFLLRTCFLSHRGLYFGKMDPDVIVLLVFNCHVTPTSSTVLKVQHRTERLHHTFGPWSSIKTCPSWKTRVSWEARITFGSLNSFYAWWSWRSSWSWNSKSTIPLLIRINAF